MATTDWVPDQVWELAVEGRRHRVESSHGALRRIRWYVDDEQVGKASTIDERFTLKPDDRTDPSRVGEVKLVFNALGRGRRATLAPPGAPEIDLEPEAGSPAALHEAKVRENPRRYAALTAAWAVGKVVGGLLVIWLISRIVVGVPWPSWDLPSVPWPDLPAIPWPDVDLPRFSTPPWLEYVAPVLIAVALAVYEVRRRRRQDARREETRRAVVEERDDV